MNQSNNPSRGIHRRDLIKGMTAASLGFAAGAVGIPESFGQASVSSTSRRNLIQIENAKPGTRDWQLTKTRQLPGKINKILNDGRCPWIEGYCSANSIRAGETLQIMVSTNPASPFKLEIFRTGYYSGDGGRLVRTYDALQGIAQPDPSVGKDYLRECQWEPSVEFEIPED